VSALPVPEWLSRHRALAATGAAALIVVVTGTAIAIASSPSGQANRPAGGVGASTAGTDAQGGQQQAQHQPGLQPGQVSGRQSGRQHQPGTGAPYGHVPSGHVATLPASRLSPALRADGMHGTRRVTLVLATGVPTLTVHVAPMDGTLVAAATAPGYGARPELGLLNEAGQGGSGTGTGDVVGLTLPSAAATGGGQLPGGTDASVTLSTNVTWQLDFGGGTNSTTVDLTGGRVSGLDFGQGSSMISVTLPKPSGTVLIKLDGGTSDLQVHAPAGIPARVTAGGGASEVQVGGASYSGLAVGIAIAQPAGANA